MFCVRNVNRRGTPPTIRACLLNERTSIGAYLYDLRMMALEKDWFASAPSPLSAADVPCVCDSERAQAHAFDTVKMIENGYNRMYDDTRVRRSSCFVGCLVLLLDHSLFLFVCVSCNFYRSLQAVSRTMWPILVSGRWKKNVSSSPCTNLAQRVSTRATRPWRSGATMARSKFGTSRLSNTAL